jgi:NTP pyrophosphatase (non-canonical NTP hydrolase)
MNEFQEKVRKFCRQHGLEMPAEERLLDIVSELGEVSKEMLKASDYGKKEPEYNEEMKAELGDLFYSLLAVANKLNVDLEEALDMVLIKYQKRIAESGSPDSKR